MPKLICFLPLFFLFSCTVRGEPQSLLRSFQSPSFSAARVCHALGEAYPEAVEDLGFRRGDWAVKVRGRWFYWEGGRFLPESLREQRENYSAHPFYPYAAAHKPPLRKFSPAEREALEALLRQREERPLSRCPELHNALYRLHDEESAWKIMKTTYFMGFQVMIHRDLLEDLARVEERLAAEMENDPALKEYIESVDFLTGFNWRPIDGTRSLSNHSYGIAIDIIPKDYRGKRAYWRWFKDEISRWYELPWENRYAPPASLVRAFEAEGFLWGGKWFFFDGIHFEYRPEILILNGLR